jgi:uncharacterized membrane protein YsdA (DUF1294 family)
MQKLTLYYLLLINIVTFFLYIYDKYQAIKKAPRVSERKLHLYTLLGGVVGATFAMLFARHKIQKKSFMLRYYFIVLIWIVWLSIYFGFLNPLNFL